MEPYRVHIDDWTVALYSTDDGRLTFTVTNSEESRDRLIQVVGEFRLRRHYIGSACAGELHQSPLEESDEPYVSAPTKEEILARQGCG